jgi:hypothetical protein
MEVSIKYSNIFIDMKQFSIKAKVKLRGLDNVIEANPRIGNSDSRRIYGVPVWPNIRFMRACLFLAPSFVT